MARKVNPTQVQEATDAVAPGAEDLNVLFPELTVSIAGESITVREYGFIDGLRVRALMAPFVAELDAMIMTAPLVEEIIDLLGRYIDATQQAVAISVSRDPAWVAALKPADGEELLFTWWAVCGPFFLRQVVRRQRERYLRKHGAAASAPDGPTSSPLSSVPDTAPPPTSADTPSAN